MNDMIKLYIFLYRYKLKPPNEMIHWLMIMGWMRGPHKLTPWKLTLLHWRRYKNCQSAPDFALRSVAANCGWCEPPDADAAAAAAAATAAAMKLLWLEPCWRTRDGGEPPSRDEEGDPDRCLDGLIIPGDKGAKGAMDEPDEGGVGVRDWAAV